jgi:DNA-binding CsgD family transcriptional regulator
VARSSDDAVLLDLVAEIMGCLELEELRYAMLEALLRAFPSRWASLNDVAPHAVVAIAVPTIEPRYFDRFGELAHENPIYQRWLRTGEGRPYRFSDVTTRAELEATRLYREIYVPLGVRHQIAFSLPYGSPDHILAIALSREDRDYSDAERDLLDRARPFLIQAYRNAVAHSAVQAAPSAAVEDGLVDAGLTRREAEVVAIVALGASNRDAAARLGVSARTVQKHLQRAFGKLGVENRSQAAARAWALGGEAEE